MRTQLRVFLPLLAVAAIAAGTRSAQAQSPRVLYTWDGAASVDDWAKNFGNNDVLLNNNTAGQLTIIEIGATAGADVAIRDGANRRLEESAATGGLDLTGLDYLEFDLGHNGSGPIDVQFYVQASTAYSYVSLGPDISVAPGVNTYQLPLAGLTYGQQVYIRTLGFSARDHAAVGNVVWTLEEVRSAGTPLSVRDLATHDAGTSDGGLQGVFANFDRGAILGNDGNQNQTGLSHDAGLGTLKWIDQGDHGVGDASGAAIAYGNGTVFNGNSFNERLTDLSNYNYVTYRMSATDVTGGGVGDSIPVQAYYQTGTGYTYQSAGDLSLVADGQFYDLTFPLAGLSNMFDVQFSGVNLGSHANDVTINIDLVRYSTIPEPATLALLAGGLAASVALRRRLR
ncbi:MAG: PEP-CTERM sorting domain-containing protein [Planctomycetales bacterium]|nr:PEP-CTERM sorting domain-containing protein [Planctomycetales bacterium]